MDWDAIGAVGEVLGALAVLITLFYLARQIRQNTEEIRSSNYHGVTDSFNELNLTVAGNCRDELSFRLAYQKAPHSSDGDISHEEKRIFITNILFFKKTTLPAPAA